jgi:Spy/CpxP family protein refolding chaperone
MLIFGTGVVTGGLLVRPVTPAPGVRNQRPPTHPAQPVTSGGRMEFLRRLQGELELTAEQREHIEELIKQSQERAKKHAREEWIRVRDEFRTVLTPEQQARFDLLLKRQQLQQQQQHLREQLHSSSTPERANRSGQPAPAPERATPASEKP